MKFTLPINRERDLMEYRKYYNHLNSKKMLFNYVMIVAGILCSTIGLFQHNPGFKKDLLVCGGIIAVTYTFILLYYINHKKKFLGEVDRQYQLFAENDVTEYTFEFSEEFFLLENELNSSKIAWHMFHSYSLIENKLVLHMTKSNGGLFYLMSKEELGNEDFERVVSFVKERVKPRTKKHK